MKASLRIDITNGSPATFSGSSARLWLEFLVDDTSVPGVRLDRYGSGSVYVVEDPQNLLTVLYNGDAVNMAKGKTGKIYVPKVAVEVNDTATAEDDVVCRYSENPAGRPVVPCRIKVAGAPPGGLNVTMTGSKLRFPNVNDTSKEISLPPSGAWVPFSISGQTASTTTGDAPIQVRLGGVNGNILAEKGVTVLWVEVSMRNTQGATFSPDNGAVTKPSPPLLGKQLLSLPNGITMVSHMVELAGNVSPSDFVSPVDFHRDNLAFLMMAQLVSTNPDPVYFPIAQGTRERNPVGNGNDTSLPDYLDLLPPPNGRIYDIDAPGFRRDVAPYTALSQGTIIFTRYNFVQYASFNNARCSDDVPWFVRLTAIKTSPAGTGVYEFHDRPGKNNDNLSGIGATTISVD